MNSEPIRSVAELPDPWVFVEVIDGRVTTLQFDRASLGRDREPDLADAVTRATNRALTRQATELLTPSDGDVDSDRDRVRDFLGALMGEAPPTSGAGSRDREPASGETSARVVDGLVDALWIDATLLDRSHPLDAEDAIRRALNEALERYEATFVDAIAAVDQADQSPGWAGLARSIDRIERGLL